MAKFYVVKSELIGAFKLLYESIERSNSFEQISKTIGDFFKEVEKINNPKNNRPNKQIDSIRTYFRKNQKDKRSQEAVVEKSIRKIRKKKPNYRDFSEQIVVWREQGHSYPQICRLLQAQTGIKISDQTIARFLKRRANEQKNRVKQ
ncbi:hypothetical protein [Campylobacter sp. CCUG 57310]|uniref:hypothetical protein n=1 Tax=Campylobacter sp. CCUG 57310 TaxID=2517362 RepID=UPI0015640256|nr:hypothetical protein [Campylobacter sp. CCUG 57310]QKF93245.1 hypothetical protein CORI_b010 [Campylobacter sp. CCUG 57310]